MLQRFLYLCCSTGLVTGNPQVIQALGDLISNPPTSATVCSLAGSRASRPVPFTGPARGHRSPGSHSALCRAGPGSACARKEASCYVYNH